jgi:hypothetical protein
VLIKIDPVQASALAERVVSLAGSAREFAIFDETDPHLAAECGVGIGALEARTLLACGAVDRVARAAIEAARTGRPASIAGDDLEAVSRLERVVALGSSMIMLKLSSMEAAAKQEPVASVGNLIGLGTGLVGLIKSIF